MSSNDRVVCTISSAKKRISTDNVWLLNLEMIEQQTGRIISRHYVEHDELLGSIVQFSADNVLYSKLRPNLNKVVLPDCDGYATSELVPLKPNSAILCREYLAAYLRSDSFVAWAASKTTGAKMPRLGTDVLLDKINTNLPLPPLDEQRRIAAVLDKVSDLIAKRRQQLEKLDELVKARFVEMFGGDNFPLVKIRDVVAPNVASSKKMFTSTDTIKYIDISSVDNIRNRVTNFTEYVLKDAPSRAQQCVREGDILVSTVRPNLRNVAMIESRGANFVASSGFCVLRAEKCSPFYLLAVVCSDEFTKAMSRAVTGANYPAIKDSDVLNYETALPPLGQQERFSVFVEQVEKVRVAAFRGLEQLETLKKALVQHYFGREVDL